MGIVFSNHAILEINRRKIKIEDVERLINNPPQKIPSKKNRTIVQGKYHDKDHNKERDVSTSKIRVKCTLGLSKSSA